MELLIIAGIAIILWLIIRSSMRQPSFETVKEATVPTSTANVQQIQLNQCRSSADCLPLYSNLTMYQKMNLFSLIVFMAGFAQTESSRNECSKMVTMTALCLGLDLIKSVNYVRKYNKDSDAIIDSIIAIPNKDVKEQFLCNCYYFVQETGHPDAQILLLGMATEMGYTLNEVESLVHTKEKQFGMV